MVRDHFTVLLPLWQGSCSKALPTIPAILLGWWKNKANQKIWLSQSCSERPEIMKFAVTFPVPFTDSQPSSFDHFKWSEREKMLWKKGRFHMPLKLAKDTTLLPSVHQKCWGYTGQNVIHVHLLGFWFSVTLQFSGGSQWRFIISLPFFLNGEFKRSFTELSVWYTSEPFPV